MKRRTTLGIVVLGEASSSGVSDDAITLARVRGRQPYRAATTHGECDERSRPPPRASRLDRVAVLDVPGGGGGGGAAAVTVIRAEPL